MKKLTLIPIYLAIILMSFSWKAQDAGIIAAGMQPQISVDPKGVLRITFGRSDSIFCASSFNQGVTFSAPVLV